MCETSQVSSGCAWASAAATGRPRSAQQASCRPWVQTQNSVGVGRGVRQAGAAAGPQAGEVEVEHVVRGRHGPGVSSRGRPGGRTPRRPARVPRARTGAGPGAADQQDADAGRRRARRRSRSPRPSGSRASRSASAPHGPGCSTQQEGAHGRRRAGDRLVAQHAGGGAAEGRLRGGALTRRPRAALRGPGAGRAPAGSAGRGGRRGRRA